jgi:hypothetical protein
VKIKQTMNHPEPTFEYKFGIYATAKESGEFYQALNWSLENFKYTPQAGVDQDAVGLAAYFWFKTEENRNWFILRYS